VEVELCLVWTLFEGRVAAEAADPAADRLVPDGGAVERKRGLVDR